MKVWKTKNGYNIFRVVTGRSNAYLVSYRGMNILVDTSTRFSYARLIKKVRSILTDREQVDILVLTHTHFDHCQNAARLRRDEGSIILGSKYESTFTIKGYTPIPKGTLPFSKFVSRVGGFLGSLCFSYPLFSLDIEVDQNYNFNDYGLNLQIVSTPGHSVGSISLTVDDEIAIVGDAMFGFFKDSILPPFADNKQTMIHSWKKLYESGCRLFLPGHGSSIERELVSKEIVRVSKIFSSKSI